MIEERLEEFIEYAKSLDGDEKGEAQVFCDRLFKAFGHIGYKEAGAILEKRVKGKKTTRFADLLWSDKMVLEMKKRGSKLESHRNQVFDYWWKLRPNQPKYSVLCNFDEFLIYDFSIQDEPLDSVKLAKLKIRYTAFNFLLPKPKTPVFENNLEDVTRETAAEVSMVFNSLIKRKFKREEAQKFILQAIFTMFAEDYNLLPQAMFTSILEECIDKIEKSYDLIGGLFKQMANPIKASGGRFKDVKYFNGGLFNEVIAFELTREEIHYLLHASKKDWSKVNPAIFGTIFQSSMDKDERHAYGAHFTSELDIYKIIHPTIITPWLSKIGKAKTFSELNNLLKAIRDFKILDPACGSGNFLYIAYRELKRLEMEILNRIYTEYASKSKKIGTSSKVSLKQFYGIDLNTFAIELAKVTMLLAKEVSKRETENWLTNVQTEMDFEIEETLPLDNLSDNLINADALFIEWPEADVIIGNPPYQSKNKMQQEYGGEYLNKLWAEYPDIPGRADFCVYWFYKAHKVMKENALAGLVGTNTIRENYSREGSLDYIIKNNGEIFNAVSSQKWSGDAAVSVSIVNWKKGKFEKDKKLYLKGGEEEVVLKHISSSLKTNTDVTQAKVLNCNKKPKKVFQGQTHGHKGFLIDSANGVKMASQDKNRDVVKPFLIAEEMVGNLYSQPKRHVIDFTLKDIFQAGSYNEPFQLISKSVLPDREAKAKEQEKKNSELLEKNPKAKTNKHHINFYNKWWKLSYGREDLLNELQKINRYIVTPQVSKRQIFEFISTDINPNAALMIFAFDDDYSFGIINSIFHWEWWKAKCSTLEERLRYTTNTVWDTFPFPQNPKVEQIKEVAKLAKKFRAIRNEVMSRHQYSLRDLYRLIEQHGKNPIKDLQNELDDAVREAYGFNKSKDILQQLLDLNFKVADKELKGEKVQAPGLPDFIENKNEYITIDCVEYISNE